LLTPDRFRVNRRPWLYYSFVVFNYVIDVLNGLLFPIFGFYIGKVRVLGFLFGIKKINIYFILYSVLIISTYLVHSTVFPYTEFSEYIRVIWNLFLINFFLSSSFDRRVLILTVELYLLSVTIYSLLRGFSEVGGSTLIFTAKNDYSPFLCLVLYYSLFIKLEFKILVLTLIASFALNSKFVYAIYVLLFSMFTVTTFRESNDAKGKFSRIGMLLLVLLSVGVSIFLFEGVVKSRITYYSTMYLGLGYDFIFTGRLEMFTQVIDMIEKNLSFLTVAIGNGFKTANASGYYTPNGIPVGTELDLVDAYYNLGILGISYFVIYFRRLFKYSSHIVPFLIVFAHSLLGGHVIFTPVSTFLVLITITLINEDSSIKCKTQKYSS